jgi:hypothetical protein
MYSRYILHVWYGKAHLALKEKLMKGEKGRQGNVAERAKT